MNFCSKTFSETAEAEGEVVFAYHKQNLPKHSPFEIRVFRLGLNCSWFM